jgi:hypothetical protein
MERYDSLTVAAEKNKCVHQTIKDRVKKYPKLYRGFLWYKEPPSTSQVVEDERKVYWDETKTHFQFFARDGRHKTKHQNWIKADKDMYYIGIKMGKKNYVQFHTAHAFAFRDTVFCTPKARKLFDGCKFVKDFQKLIRDGKLDLDHKNSDKGFALRHHISNYRVMTKSEHSKVSAGKRAGKTYEHECSWRYEHIGDESTDGKGSVAMKMIDKVFPGLEGKKRVKKSNYLRQAARRKRNFAENKDQRFTYCGKKFILLRDEYAPESGDVVIKSFKDENGNLLIVDVNVTKGYVSRHGKNNKWCRGGCLCLVRGYWNISFKVNGKKKHYLVHRLVALASPRLRKQYEEWVQANPGKTPIVLHKPDEFGRENKTDNRECALRWGSSSDNAKDRVACNRVQNV